MKTKKIFLGTFLIIGAMCFTVFGGAEKDREGDPFKTVMIGRQVWMAENLNTAHFRNGDLIPEAKTRSEWQRAFLDRQPAWCYYGNDAATGALVGRLYNWYAVSDPRGLAPAGWHVPSDAEWMQLTDYLGGGEAAGTALKNDSGWKENGGGSNQSRFAALPGGACADDGYLGSIGYLGVWWSATADTSYAYDADAYAWYRYLYYSKDSVIRYAHSKGNGFSVRCLRD